MQLTKTEIEIINQVKLGKSSHVIADQRFRSQDTIQSHIKNARAKMGAKTIAELVYLCMKNGVINSFFAVLISTQVLPAAKRNEDLGGDSRRRLKVSRSFSMRGGKVREQLL